MNRIRIKGTKDIVFDPIPKMKAQIDDAEPGINFFRRTDKQLKFRVISFPSSAFPHEITPETMKRYLDGRAIELSEQQFQIIEEPLVTTGPAKFRILGQRALSFRYGFETESGRVIRAENWLLYDGMVHVVIIDGSPRTFDWHFKQVKAALNSMSYFNDSN